MRHDACDANEAANGWGNLPNPDMWYSLTRLSFLTKAINDDKPTMRLHSK